MTDDPKQNRAEAGAKLPLLYLETVGSTMDVARQQVLAGRLALSEGAVLTGVVAREQTTGRGQRGRSWFARPGESLCATFVVPITPAQTGVLALQVGIALAQWLHDYSQQTGVNADAGLKWPNDVLLNGKKLGGVLIEATHTPDGQSVALIGVGLNLAVVNFPEELAAWATSLAQEGIAPPNWQEAARQIAQAIADSLRKYPFDSSAVVACWQTWDRTSGRLYAAVREGVTVYGVAEGIDSNGALRLRVEGGAVWSVQSATALRELPAV